MVVFANSLQPQGDSLHPLCGSPDDSPPQKLGVNVCSAVNLYDQHFTLGGKQKRDVSLIAASEGLGWCLGGGAESGALDSSLGSVLGELWWNAADGELSNAAGDPHPLPPSRLPEHRSRPSWGWLRVRWPLWGTSGPPGSQIPARNVVKHDESAKKKRHLPRAAPMCLEA